MGWEGGRPRRPSAASSPFVRLAFARSGRVIGGDRRTAIAAQSSGLGANELVRKMCGAASVRRRPPHSVRLTVLPDSCAPVFVSSSPLSRPSRPSRAR